MSSANPQLALERARERGVAAREAGEYAEAERFAVTGAVAGDDLLKLHEWAFIEVDVAAKVYSTRRLGAPITLVKRALLRALAQYHDEQVAQQTRFNLHLVGAVARLHGRVARLEQLAAERNDRS